MVGENINFLYVTPCIYFIGQNVTPAHFYTGVEGGQFLSNVKYVRGITYEGNFYIGYKLNGLNLEVYLLSTTGYSMTTARPFYNAFYY